VEVRTVIGLGSASVVLALLIHNSSSYPVAAGVNGAQTWQQATPPFHQESDVFIVTEDHAILQVDGCDSISSFTLGESNPIRRGTWQPSPSRLAATSDLSLIVASPSNGLLDADHAIYVSQCTKGNLETCREAFLRGLPEPLPGGGVAISPNDKYIFLAVKRIVGTTKLHEEYGVSRFEIADIDWAANILGGGVGFYNVAHGQAPSPSGESNSSYPTEILPSADSRFVHIVVEPGLYSAAAFVATIDAETLQDAAPRIPIPANHPQNEDERSPRSGSDFFFPGNMTTHGSLTLDGRYLIINRWEKATIIVADLVARSYWEVPIPGFEPADTVMAKKSHAVAGVALNLAGENRGLVAIHGINRIGIFALSPDARSLTGRSLTPVSPVFHFGTGINGDVSRGNFGLGTGPIGAVAWSTDGRHLIAAGAATGEEEFQSWRVSNDGQILTNRQTYEACAHRETNLHNDILTLNGRSPPPPPTTTVPPGQSSTPPTDTSTPTVTPSTTGTATPSVTPAPTDTPTQPRALVLLPLLLRERCVPEESRADVVLVMDASTSMLERAGPSDPRSKLDVARTAAGDFVRSMRLDRGDRAAVLAFNSEARLLQALTSDARALVLSLEGITTAQQTRIDLGIEMAYDLLRRSPADRRRAMIVLTDGRSNPVGPERAVRLAREAHEAGMIVFTVGLGQDLDVEALALMASQPEFFYQPSDATYLGAIYVQIARTIPCPASEFWPRR